MKFTLVDAILSMTDDEVVAIKHVSLAEEYLQDHFPGYPILPGVLMLEAMVQAARQLLQPRADHRLVLGRVRSLKYGAMVPPGRSLRVTVRAAATDDDGCIECRGSGVLVAPGDAPDADRPTAVSGRFQMRPVRTVATLPVSG